MENWDNTKILESTENCEDSEQWESTEESKKIGWEHYLRKCSLYCYQCQEFHTCRFWHDDIHENNFKDIKKSHKLDRHNIELLKCLVWGNIQKPDHNCSKCGIRFAEYSCLKWNLFDEEGMEKELYHCSDWGICRQGGAENSYHCPNCDICLPLSMKDNHECSNFRQSQCPICFEDFFSIRDAGCRLKCGHLIHSKCFDLYFKTSFSCPLCKKFAFSDEVKEKIYAQIEEEIANTVMSEELQNLKVDIICNDCQQKGPADFNIIALKWSHWGGYNTNRVKA